MLLGRTAIVLTSALLAGISPTWERATAEKREKSVEFEVEKHADMAYRTDKEADPVRHKLDLYVPVGAKNYPLIVYVHGGAWKTGSKNLYVGLGRALARHGIGVAVINYRLSPKVKHPAHAEDVARAFAWVRTNIPKYGGDPDLITLMGHSAGGHLVSLIATDPSFLKLEELEPSQIRGVITVSGVYQIEPTSELTMPASGSDADLCKKASPLTHVEGKHPPFLIAYAEHDYEHFDRMAMNFHAALEKHKTPATLIKLMHRNHISEIVSILSDDDALNQAVRKFVLK